MSLYEKLRNSANALSYLPLDAPNAEEIFKVCVDLAQFLIEKNAAYGNSALEPLRVMSKSDPAEQIRVRMDDKLSRLVRGQAAGEDAMKDLVGYWVLLEVLLEQSPERCEGCAANAREFGTRCSKHRETA